MDACEYSIKIITVPAAERITQTMDDCKFSFQNKYSTIQRMDECHSSCDKNRYTTSKVGCLQLESWNK